MIDYFCDPWPNDASCPVCKRPITVSYYDKPSREAVFEHEDRAFAACRALSNSPAMQANGFGITFAVQVAAEFQSLDDAVAWARARVLAKQDDAIPLGYVRGHDGHRVIGALRAQANAIAVVRREGETVVVDEAKA